MGFRAFLVDSDVMVRGDEEENESGCEVDRGRQLVVGYHLNLFFPLFFQHKFQSFIDSAAQHVGSFRFINKYTLSQLPTA